MRFLWPFLLIIVSINAGCIANKDIKVSGNKVTGVDVTVTSPDAETLKAQNAALTHQISSMESQLAEKNNLLAQQSNELKGFNDKLSGLQEQVQELQNTITAERQQAAMRSHHAANPTPWYITTIANRTRCTLEFCVLNSNGQWERQVLRPNQQITLSRMENGILVNFGPNQWTLDSQTPGDEQTYYFGVDSNGYVTLFSDQ